MSEPEVPSAGGPVNNNIISDTWFYVACGVGGGVILLLLLAIVILGVWVQKRGRKIKRLIRDAEKTAMQPQTVVYQTDNVQLLPDRTVPAAVAPATMSQMRDVYREERTIIHPVPSASEHVNHEATGTAVITNSTVTRPYVPNGSTDVSLIDKERRRLTRKERAFQEGQDELPRLRPDNSWPVASEYQRIVSRNAERVQQSDVYGQEMEQYRSNKHVYSKNNGRFFEEIETSSAVLPRVQPKHKHIKQTNSIPEMYTIGESNNSSEALRGGWSYLGAGASAGGAGDRNLPVVHGNVGRHSSKRRQHRPLAGELSNEEFNKRRSFIERSAMRRPRGSPRQSRRNDGLVRTNPGRYSASASPNSRYLYPTGQD